MGKELVLNTEEPCLARTINWGGDSQGSGRTKTLGGSRQKSDEKGGEIALGPYSKV